MFNVGSPNEIVPVEIDEMTIADYDDVLSLLRASPGVAFTRSRLSRGHGTLSGPKPGAEFCGEMCRTHRWLRDVRS